MREEENVIKTPCYKKDGSLLGFEVISGLYKESDVSTNFSVSSKPTWPIN